MLSDLSIGFVVLIIPSKERTIYEWMKRRERNIDELEGLVKNELKLVQVYKDFFAGNGIAYVDALAHVVQAFELAIEKGATFYPTNNAHPLRAGYAAYATTAIEGLDLTTGSRGTERGW